MLNELRKIADKNSLEQPAVAAAFTFQNVICPVRQRLKCVIGSFYCIIQIGRIVGDVEQFYCCSNECSLVVGKNPVFVDFQSIIRFFNVVPDGAGFFIEQG